MDAHDEAPDEREQRLNEVIAAYLEFADAGCAPDRGELLAHYPDLEPELREFLDAQDRVSAIASPPAAVDETEPVGDYESLEKIKEGGMGTVFKAWHKGMKNWVALKKIRADRLGSPAEVARCR